MFIPGWLLAVVGVVALLMLWRALVPLLLILAIPALLASGLLAYFFVMKKQYVLASIYGSPAMVMMLWVMWRSAFNLRTDTGRFNAGAMRLRLWLHGMRTTRRPMPKDVMDARIKFACSIGLGPTLLRLYDDVKHMPSWYQGDKWSSNVVRKEDVSRVPVPKLAEYGVGEPGEHSGRDSVVLRFAAGEEKCAFVAYEVSNDSWVGDVEDEPEWMFSTVKVWVVSLSDKHILLEDKVVYRSGDLNVYRSDFLEGFHPGAWLVALYQLRDAIREESEARHELLARKWDDERAKRFT